MTTMPGTAVKLVQNHGDKMAAHNGLVLHVQVGNNSLFGMFNNPASQASSTFWLSKAGGIEQYVDAELTAWAQAAGNSFYNSVETEGYPNEPLTPQQISGVARIFVWGHRQYGWPLQACDHGGKGLTTHAHYPSGEVDSRWGGHACPGGIRLSQVTVILEEAAKLLNVNPPKPIPRPSPSPQPAQPHYPGFPGRIMRLTSPMMHGADIAMWQAQMRHRGWRIAIDGWYGGESAKVCHDFQVEKHLRPVDGIVGPVTWKAAWILAVT